MNTRWLTDGYSLIEVLIVVGFVGLLAAVSVPVISGAMRSYSLISASQQVVSMIRAARVHAVGSNATLRVRFNHPEDGQYRVLGVVGGADQVLLGKDKNETLGTVRYLPTGAEFGDVSGDLAFDPSGRVTPPGGAPVTIEVTNGEGGQTRTITVSASGRVELVP